MPKYKIVIEFDSELDIPEEVMDELAACCAVQVESLSDGDLECSEKFGTFDYGNTEVNWRLAKEDEGGSK